MAPAPLQTAGFLHHPSHASWSSTDSSLAVVGVGVPVFFGIMMICLWIGIRNHCLCRRFLNDAIDTTTTTNRNAYMIPVDRRKNSMLSNPFRRSGSRRSNDSIISVDIPLPNVPTHAPSGAKVASSCNINNCNVSISTTFSIIPPWEDRRTTPSPQPTSAAVINAEPAAAVTSSLSPAPPRSAPLSLSIQRSQPNGKRPNPYVQFPPRAVLAGRPRLQRQEQSPGTPYDEAISTFMQMPQGPNPALVDSSGGVEDSFV